MSELRTKSLAHIVNSNHRTASVFEKYHLDFCCKGRRTLYQACEESQIPVDQIIAELENITDSCSVPVHFSNMSLTQLAEYIVMTHHVYVKEKMPSILLYLQKIASKHALTHPEMVKVLETFTALKEDMEQHMQKEELILFPRIKTLEKITTESEPQNTDLSYLQSPITLMEEEHDHAGLLLEEIRKLTNNYTPTADGCTTYNLCYAALQAFEFDLHQHVHLENHILFPKTLDLIKKLNNPALN